MHKIRLAKANDVGILVSLMATFYAESDYYFDTKKATDAFAHLLLTESVGLCWLLEADSKYIGYIAVTFTYSLEYFGLAAFIDDLYIHPNYRRRGLARQLLVTAEAECLIRRVLVLHLEVGKENQPANKLYSAYGFGKNNRLLLNKRLENKHSHEE